MLLVVVIASDDEAIELIEQLETDRAIGMVGRRSQRSPIINAIVLCCLEFIVFTAYVLYPIESTCNNNE